MFKKRREPTKNALFSATSILSQLATAYITTFSLDKLSCTNCVDFCKCQNRFGQFSRIKNGSNYLDVKLEVFEQVDNNFLRQVQNLKTVEADVNTLMHLRSQLIIATENIGGGENLSPVLKATLSKYMDEQPKLAHKMVDVVDRANRKICVALLRHSVDKPESSYAQVEIFARKKEDQKFQQIVYLKFNFEKFTYLLDVMNAVYDKVVTNQPICEVL